ncbi:MAG: branched-chain amino acid ABC transporter substrate-binding protein [Actinomycetota bacterium]|nr:branched-chain amino acid ABC transporter substrate-binding protein [Actinomycetota bacterium]
MTVGKSKLLLALVAVLVMVAMVVTGCGTKTEDADSGTGDELVTVKLGVGAPLTQGAVALGKGIERGAMLAIDDAAAELEAAGIKVEAFVVDDQGDPKVGVNVANQLASDPAVIGVDGHLNSGVSIPGSAVYNQAGFVQISPASTNPQLTLQGFKNVFRVCTIDPVQGSFAADAALNQLGFKSAFVVDDSTPYGEGLADEFAKAFEAAGGKTLGREKTGDKDTDFNALVTKIKAEKPDAIYYGGIYNAGALFAKQASEGGFEGSFFSGDGIYSPDYISLAGAANAEGDLCTSVGLPLDQQPKGEEFKTKFAAKYPGEEIQAYDTYAYDAAWVILQAVKTVATDMGADKVTTTEGKQAIIDAVAATNLEGITGAVSFDANGDTTNKAITLYVVKNGEWVPYE